MRQLPHPILLVAILAVAAPGRAQVVECTLARSGEAVRGECLGAAVELLPGIPGESPWRGTLAIADTVIDIDIVMYGYAAGPTEVFRTPWGWFIPSRLDLEADPPQLAWSMSDEAPPARGDLEILARARSLIRSEAEWDRADDRACSRSDTTWSLYCALAEATRIVDGRYQHRQPALQTVRRIVGEGWPERIAEHRLMDFNNDPRTTYADLHAVFDLAEERLRETIR